MKRCTHLIVLFSALLFSSGLLAQAGSPDLNFNGDGSLIFSFGSDGSYGKKTIIGNDGTIWLSGTSYNSASQMGLAKVFPDGSLDLSFNFDGAIGVNVEGNEAQGENLDIQADGKILVCGSSALGSGDMALARINPDGTLDNDFGGGDARVRYDIGEFDNARAVKAAPDGKIFLAGWTSTNNIYNGVVAKLNSDGSLDSNFDGDGIRTFNINAESGFFDMELLPDGKILLAGYTLAADYDFLVVRLNPDGSFDNSFGTNGWVELDFGNYYDYALAMDLAPNGKIVLTGVVAGGTFTAARLNADGSSDTSFSFDGVNFTNVGDFGESEDLIVQPDNKIVVVGYTYNSADGYYKFGAVRYTETGLLDTEFGNNGILRLDVGDDGDDDYGYGVAIQSDGLIVISGQSNSGGEENFAVVRILSGLNVGLFEQGLEQIQSYVYPNPISAGQELQLEYELKEATEVTIQLVDLSGRSSQLLLGDRMAGKQKESLRLPANLAAGVYTIQIRTDKGISSIRIEKF